jgi:hypothetical protein
MSTEWISGGPDYGFGTDGDAVPQASYLNEAGDAFVFRKTDGDVRDLHRRLERGLGPQVRPFSETLSLNDVFEAERIRQQTCPAHDQGPFDGTSDKTLADCAAKFPHTAPFKGTVKIADQPIAEITSLHIDGIRCEKADVPEAPPAGQIDVTGSLTVYYQDSKLLDEFLYGPVVDPLWKRELMWAVHNLIAHPISEITYWIGALIPPVRRFGEWLHDLTIPAHAPNTGRG